MAGTDKLARYRAKRDFHITPEPGPARRARQGEQPIFVVQKHHASHLHYDFRLEIGGALASWAVPKGPSLDPADKRLAMHVEDHPLDYANFEGTIPPGQYGAGTVIVWDRGTWVPEGDPARGVRAGRLKFQLEGEKLRGGWTLVRTRGRDDDERRESWLLIKEQDEFAQPHERFDVVEAWPDSVLQHPLQAELPHGRRAALPERMKPQLATLVERPPAEGEDWIYEIKLDGYRLLARLDHGTVRLFTRNGLDWSDKLRPQCEALKALAKDHAAWIDGEIVVFDDDERPSFQRLQNAFEQARAGSICFIAFDLPYLDGEDLRELPLRERRARLRELLQPHLSERLRFSEALPGDPAQLLRAACGMQLEGLIGKRAEAPYVEGRSKSWIKLKCQQRQEFVIVGFTDPQGSRAGLGSLLLAVHDAHGALRYAGRVGTGFDTRGLKSLRERLDALATARSPLPARVPGTDGAHWVKPQLVAEVAFTEWTSEGVIRHPVFQGLRSDKPAREIGREHALPRAPSADAGDKPVVHGVAISHPGRVLDAASGATKLELARYYEAVAPHMLPHLQARPVALLRAPEGIGGELFFQKHLAQIKIPKVHRLGPEIDPPHPSLIVIDHPTALVGAAQMGVIEFHTWNAVYTRIEKPDRLVFDLDPGEGLPWARVVEAAELTKTLLDELGLVSFLKTSGGKGLHIVVPLQRRHDWDFCKRFSQAVTLHLAHTLPKRFAGKMGAANRVGKVFVDYLRNSRGATSACAFSARARPHLGVSVPVAWDELVELRSGAHWTIRTLPQRLDDLRGHDPWQDYEASRQTLTAADRLLRNESGAGSGRQAAH